MKLESDFEIEHLLQREIGRQQHAMSLIASENIVSDGVLAALGSGIVNKTVEGFPGRRFHAGCTVVDQLEILATDRARNLFGASYANVQAHSGTQANQAALAAMLKPGERILSMALADGGHLSHGASFNLSGAFYQAHHYSVDPATDRLNLEQVREMARTVRPAVIIAGASSYPRDIDYAGFAAIAAEVGARLLVDIAHFAGLVASGLINDPVPHADVVTMSTYKGLRGPRGGLIVSRDAGLGASINRGIFPFAQGTPSMNAVAAKAVCLYEAAQDSFTRYCQRSLDAARLLQDQLLEDGLKLITGGTDTSMLMVDLRAALVDGDEVTNRLERVGILANRNLVPRDQRSSSTTSGVRLSTAGIMSRGVPLEAIGTLARIIAACTQETVSDEALVRWQREVHALCQTWPLSARGSRIDVPPAADGIVRHAETVEALPC